MEFKTANYEAMFHCVNGDVEWERGCFMFMYNPVSMKSNYRERLIEFLENIENRHKMYHVTIWVDGMVQNVLRISNVDRLFPKDWEGVLQNIRNDVTGKYDYK